MYRLLEMRGNFFYTYGFIFERVQSDVLALLYSFKSPVLLHFFVYVSMVLQNLTLCLHRSFNVLVFLNHPIRRDNDVFETVENL